MKKLFFYTLLTISLLVACDKSSFDSQDPKVTELILAIREYEKTEGEPPKNLEDLVPSYISEISEPNSVTKIVSILNESDNFWTLEFQIKSGASCTYESLDVWGCRPPIPSNFE